MFIFTPLFGASKGFTNTLKAFIETFDAPQRILKIKILSYFFLFVRDRGGKV